MIFLFNSPNCSTTELQPAKVPEAADPLPLGLGVVLSGEAVEVSDDGMRMSSLQDRLKMSLNECQLCQAVSDLFFWQCPKRTLFVTTDIIFLLRKICQVWTDLLSVCARVYGLDEGRLCRRWFRLGLPPFKHKQSNKTLIVKFYGFYWKIYGLLAFHFLVNFQPRYIFALGSKSMSLSESRL